MSPSSSCGELACSPSISPRRILFLTLEYKAGTFSGNGIYSQSMVRSLSRLGHSVFVVSSGPKPKDGTQPNPTQKSHEHELLEIPVDVWGRLDWSCDWKEFAAGVSPAMAERVALFRPEWAFVVDWSALGAYKALAQHGAAWAGVGWALPRLTYLNYRVYTLSEYKGEKAAEEKEFYRRLEAEAVGLAGAVAALQTRDAKFLQTQLGVLRPPGAPQARALLPPLREDIRQRALAYRDRTLAKGGAGDLGPPGGVSDVVPASTSSSSAAAAQTDAWSAGRKYLSCCVRLSPEKNADLFAALVEQLAPVLEELGVAPLLCAGASSGDAYAQSIKRRVKEAAPSALVIEGFLGPERMGELYSQTLLNVHPCLYDAYGMTMVEAAAFGAPSVVNFGPGGTVGATELLLPAEGFAFPVDLSQDPARVAARLQELLRSPEKLERVGKAAEAKSLSWSEEANARELTCIAEEAQVAIPV